MKKWRKAAALLLSTILLVSLMACASDTPSSSDPVSQPSAPASSAAEDPGSEAPSDPASEPEETDVTGGETLRQETLYFGTGQWGPVINYNPLSGNSNNSLSVEQSDMARVLTYETP